MPIISFSGNYDFLSNMFVCLLVDMDGTEYRSSEHYYQAHKIHDACERYEIISASTPRKSKALGRKCELRPDWNDVKDQVMETALRLKFNNEYLRNKLIETHPHELIEGNYWGDTYWGVCDGRGQNKLGMLLMKIRDEFVSLQNELKNIEVIRVTSENIDEIFGIIEPFSHQKRHDGVEKQ